MPISAADTQALSLAAIRELEKIRDFEVDPEPSKAERLRAIALIDAYVEAELQDALASFRSGTARLLDLLAALTPRVQALGSGGRDVVARANALLSQVHDAEAMRSAARNAAEADATPATDEAELPPPQTPPDKRPLDPAAKGSRLDAPTPLPKGSFEQLADEYVRFFLGADITANTAFVRDQADRALANKGRYEAVGNPLGIPWWFIAAIHMLESSFNFTTNLCNGEPLTRRTMKVPAGRPAAGAPPFAWEAAARDALQFKKLDGLAEWSLPRALNRWEIYNGWGYRNLGVASPYLWSMSSIYRRGKFVADHVFDGTAVSKQCGAATLLKELQRRGAVALHLDFVDDGTEDDPAPLVEAPVPPAPVPAQPAGAPDFPAFLRSKIPDLGAFRPEEFMFLGNSNASAPEASRNSPAPEALWPNVLPLVRVMIELRRRIGQPVVFNSLYRSPAYNKFVGGVQASQHSQFKACDFHVTVPGSTPRDWAAVARQMRAAGLFSGGIGTYKSFVHVDTRGFDADWTG